MRPRVPVTVIVTKVDDVPHDRHVMHVKKDYIVQDPFDFRTP